jgi:hypothetical protein
LTPFGGGRYCFDYESMRKTRTLVAVTLLATALCADRSVAPAAAQSARVEAGPTATRQSFGERLTVSLRRTVPAVKLHADRQEGLAQAANAKRIEGGQSAVQWIVGGPFEFRLPPPLA